MGPRELDERIQLSALSDIKAALPKIAAELKLAKIRPNGKAARPAHLAIALLCDYLLTTGRPRFAMARKAFASLEIVQKTRPEYDFVFCKKGDPALQPESVATDTQHGIGVRGRKGRKVNSNRVDDPLVGNGSPQR